MHASPRPPEHDHQREITRGQPPMRPSPYKHMRPVDPPRSTASRADSGSNGDQLIAEACDHTAIALQLHARPTQQPCSHQADHSRTTIILPAAIWPSSCPQPCIFEAALDRISFMQPCDQLAIRPHPCGQLSTPWRPTVPIGGQRWRATEASLPASSVSRGLASAQSSDLNSMYAETCHPPVPLPLVIDDSHQCGGKMLPGGIARPPGAVDVGRRWSVVRRRRTRASLRSTKADGVMVRAPVMEAARPLPENRRWRTWDGNTLISSPQIADSFVQYYENLLGSSSPVRDFDMESVMAGKSLPADVAQNLTRASEFDSSCLVSSTLLKGFLLIGAEVDHMGEAPAFYADDTKKIYGNGLDLVSRGSATTSIVVGDMKYVIGGTEDDSAVGVNIFHRFTGHWSNPIILGTKPTHSGDLFSLLLGDNHDRILVVKSNSSLDDSIWFLEVDTKFVKQQRENLGSDVVAWSKGIHGYPGKPVVITGPSGVGKGTLISKLMKEFPSTFGFSVSHTTRAPRENEVNGVHYHFTERSLMEKEIQEGKFLEFASVHGNLYGTSVEAVEVVADAGKRCILDIDVQGARSVKASSLEAIFIFICPPSFEDLEKRLRARGTETEVQIQKRLQNAKVELEQGRSPGLFDRILVNDDLEACYERLKELLGLWESSDVSVCPVPVGVDLPPISSVTKVDEKMLINCVTEDLGKASTTSFVLDVSSLKGGAPGRTRGFYLYPMKNNIAD
ncbi:Guanylate kinase 2 [Dionaea muscipula]